MSDDSSDRSVSRSLSPSDSRDALYERLRQYQLERNEALKAVKHAKRQLADITNSESPSKPAKKAKKQQVDGMAETEKELRLVARKFTLMKMLWLRDTERTFSTDPSEDYVPLDRFQDIDSKIQGQIADILDIVPAKYHSDWAANGSTWFKRYFQDEMTQQRSNISHRLRETTGQYVFFCTRDEMATSESRRLHFHKIIGLPEEGEVYDPMNVAVLHKDYAGKRDIDTIFLNDALLEIFSSLIYGASSVYKIRQKSSPKASGTVAGKWCLHNTTPGAIAACAVLARWVASPDDELQSCGEVSGISWLDDFELYLEYLSKGVRNRTRAILNIFAVWDSIFFKDTTTSLGGGAIGTREAFGDAMAELEEAETVDDAQDEAAE